MLMVFLKKILIWGKWAILGLEMACPYNSGSTLKIFLKFFAMKGVKKYMKLILMVFMKKSSFWGKWVILTQKWHIIITLDPL